MAADFLSGSSYTISRYQALLKLVEVVGRQTTIGELFQELAQQLKTVVDFDFMNLSVHDAQTQSAHLHIWEGTEMVEFPEQVPVSESASGWVLGNQRPLVFSDLHIETRFPATLDVLRERGVNSYCLLPLTTSRKRLGAIGFGSSRKSAYLDDDIQFLGYVSNLVASAAEAAETQQELADEKGRLQTLLDITTAVVSRLSLEQSIPEISAAIARRIPCEYGSVVLQYDERSIQLHALDFPLAKQILGAETILPIKEHPAERVLVTKQTRCLGHSELASLPSKLANRMVEAGLRSLCSAPLMHGEEVFGVLNIGSVRDGSWSLEHATDLDHIARQLAITLEAVRTHASALDVKQKLRSEKQYLEQEIRSELGFEEIIGNSPALLRTLAEAREAAATNATILILGETGTGKDLIARAAHRMSNRANASFIKLNCAAIPSGLLESELFGHEKGAFTGAVSPKLGRMELADKGTLFLDEVGEIPLELQPKLLRALEDQEFERLGSNRTIRVDVRLIAATNRDLAAAMSDRKFRSDLYYRLNVFPIRMPSLSERRDDIPMLVTHFVQRFARKMNKKIETIPTETMNALAESYWPGNVRELENFIERSVILTQGPVLRAPLAELEEENAPTETLEDIKRETIIRALRETRGRIAGPNGAAARLGVKRTTLQSMIQRHKIDKHEFEQ